VSGTVSQINDIVTVSVNTLSFTTVSGTVVTMTVGSQTQTASATGTTFRTRGFTLGSPQDYTAVARVSGGPSPTVPFSTS
jgi:hypothetical protein